MGTEGSLKVEPYQDSITVYQPQSVELLLPAYSFDNTPFGKISGVYRDEFAHFVECVRMGTPPIISPEQALSAVLVCSAIEQSLKEGVTVRINQENVFENSD